MSEPPPKLPEGAVPPMPDPGEGFFWERQGPDGETEQGDTICFLITFTDEPHWVTSDKPHVIRNSVWFKLVARLNAPEPVTHCDICQDTGLTPGWVPSYGNPDNSGCAQEAEPCDCPAGHKRFPSMFPPPSGAKGEEPNKSINEIATFADQLVEELASTKEQLLDMTADRNDERAWAKHYSDKLAEAKRDNASLLDLIYKIRVSAGDPHGKLMLDELAPHIAKLRADLDSARKESFERAAQICRYYLKHQDQPSRWDDQSEYEKGTTIACGNLAKLMLDELPTPSSEQEPVRDNESGKESA